MHRAQGLGFAADGPSSSWLLVDSTRWGQNSSLGDQLGGEEAVMAWMEQSEERQVLAGDLTAGVGERGHWCLHLASISWLTMLVFTECFLQ